MSVWVVVGGQYGSEGKGKISAYIAQQEKLDYCVRCGGPNSGHSLEVTGRGFVLFRQLPTAAIHAKTRLLIPAGGIIDLDVLRSEIESLGLDPSRVGVDRNAMVLSNADKDCEASQRLQERLSSTLCGVGSAVSRRALRTEDVELASGASVKESWLKPFLTDVCAELNAAVRRGQNLLVEGTQGSGLSLYHTEHYPKATSRDTNASGFLSEVGLSPRVADEIVVVFRTFPIRVAGEQAGPLNGGEITWEQLRTECKSPIPLSEYTSVTKKLRRIGRFDWEAASRAALINRPTKIAVNFLDYVEFANRGVNQWTDLSKKAQEFVSRLESLCSAPAAFIGTGPNLLDTFTNHLTGDVRPGTARDSSATVLQ